MISQSISALENNIYTKCYCQCDCHVQENIILNRKHDLDNFCVLWHRQDQASCRNARATGWFFFFF